MISVKKVLEKVDEKALLISIVGTLETIKNGGITIDEAEKFLFSPHMIKILRVKRCNEKIIELIAKGCELEDIASLLPEKLDEAMGELKKEAIKIVKNYEEYNNTFWLQEWASEIYL